MKKIFIDTEFTDFIHTSMISLGMVTDAGEEEYIETTFNVKECSDFVKVAVLPQLGQVPNAFCPRPDLRLRILTWLSRVRQGDEDVVILFDYTTDWDLFIDALDHQVPAWCKGANVAYHINSLLQREHFAKTGQQEHHALHDARANCYAYREPAS